MIYGTESPQFKELMKGRSEARNGAYWYAREIESNIAPLVDTERDWVLLNVRGMCTDHAIVFIHNNLYPDHYSWLSQYDDLVLVCGIPETVVNVAHLGTAVYLPLSIDVEHVAQFRREKDRRVCYAGRRSKLGGKRFPRKVDMLTGLNRDDLLRELARYRQCYAVGRCALEAKALGCEVLPYDPRFPDPSFWQVLDNRDAASMLQGILDVIDGRCDGQAGTACGAEG